MSGAVRLPYRARNSDKHTAPERWRPNPRFRALNSNIIALLGYKKGLIVFNVVIMVGSPPSFCSPRGEQCLSGAISLRAVILLVSNSVPNGNRMMDVTMPTCRRLERTTCFVTSSFRSPPSAVTSSPLSEVGRCGVA